MYAIRSYYEPDLLEAIAELEPDIISCPELAVAMDAGRIIAVAGLEQVALLQLLFFGNRRQSLTDFVLSDLGVARYYPYRLDRQHRLFPDRVITSYSIHYTKLYDPGHWPPAGCQPSRGPPRLTAGRRRSPRDPVAELSI